MLRPFVFVFFLGMPFVGSCHGDQENIITRFAQFEKHISNYIKDKCYQKGPQAYEEYVNATMLTRGPEFHNMTPPSSPESTYTFICQQLPEPGYKYFKAVMEKLSYCLDAQFMTDFVVTTYNNTIQQRCQIGREAFINRLNALVDVYCNNNFYDTFKIIMSTCGPKLVIYQHANNFDTKKPVTEAFICGDLSTLAECVVETINKECNHNAFANYIADFMEPALSWCREKVNLDL